MTIRAVIFDLDGTIASFNLDYKTLRSEVRSYLMKMGVPPSLVTVNESIFEMLSKTELFMSNAGKPAAGFEEIRKEALRIAEKYELEASMQTSMLPGALDTLRALRRMGIKIGLCTINSANSIDQILKRFKLTDDFDVVVSRNQVGRYKPNPEHCTAALKELKVSVDEVMIVGDSITDIQAANEVKAISVGLPTGVSTREQLIKQGANYIITSISDLPILIERLNEPGTKKA